MKPLLPQLTQKLAPGPVQGSWNINPRPVFSQIAQSLKYPDDDITSNINSIPSPWARALLFQAAFLNKDHPSRKSLINEYIGFLACLAFSQVKALPIQANMVDLENLKERHSFADSLCGLLPSEKDSVLQTNVSINPWSRLYTFSLNGCVLGFTSPATLAVPAIALDPRLRDSIPWIEESKSIGPSSRQRRSYRFGDPQQYLSKPEKSAFTAWISNIIQSLSTLSGNQDLGNRLKQILADYISDLAVPPSSSDSNARPTQAYGIALNPPPLQALELTIDPNAVTHPSQVELLPGIKEPVKPIFVVDKQLIPQILNRPEHEIYVEGATTLASFQHRKTETKAAYYWTAKDFFLPRMRWFRGAGALSGSWLNDLQPDKESRTVIPPLNPGLRYFFSSDDLKSRLKLSEVQTGEGLGIRVSLELEISGTDGRQSVLIYQDYPFRSEDALNGELPYLALWPDLPSTSNWTTFHTLVEESGSSAEAYAFKLEQTTPTATDTIIKGDSGNQFRLWVSSSHPDILSLLDKRGDHIGLIPIKIPSTPSGRSSEWTIGVDFGTSFTNLHVSRAGACERLDLSMLTLNIIYKPLNFETNKNYFIPAVLTAPRDGSNPPMSTLLTIKGRKESDKTPRFIAESRLYVPSPNDSSMPDYVISDIKWTKPKYLDAFLTALINLVSAYAARYDVKRINWKASFPTAFSSTKIQRYQNAWMRAIEGAKGLSDIDHYLGSDGNPASAFRTESIVFAQYFVDVLGEQIGYATCLDIGGGTSDISIWKGLTLKHQLSVPFAGRDIFHKTVGPNISRIGEILGIEDTKESDKMLNDLKNSGDNIGAYLDNYLRLNGEDVLTRLRNGGDSEVINGFRGLLALAYAGIYYYIGLSLSYLGETEATPVYVGGNGSRFINWIDPDGRFGEASEINRLLGFVLAKAGKFSTDQIKSTVLSPKPKEEAAGGLVIEQTKLKALSSSRPEAFAGMPMEFVTEDGTIELRADQELVLPSTFKTIKEIKIQDLSELSEFVSAFNEGIRYFRIKDIVSPLDESDLSGGLSPIEFQLRNMIPQLLNQKLANDNSRMSYEPDPGFIVVHKALIQVLANKWAKSNK